MTEIENHHLVTTIEVADTGRSHSHKIQINKKRKGCPENGESWRTRIGADDWDPHPGRTGGQALPPHVLP